MLNKNIQKKNHSNERLVTVVQGKELRFGCLIPKRHIFKGLINYDNHDIKTNNYTQNHYHNFKLLDVLL